MKKTIYIICATGVATSTMLRVKIQSFLEEHGIDATIRQYRVTEVSPDRTDADLIVATTRMGPEFQEVTQVIDGVPLITGQGEEETLDKILDALQED
jgi:PTS system galactitol-specific IIB component